MKDNQTQPSPILVGSGVIGLLALMLICLLLAFNAPSSWKEWGGAGALIGTASVYFLRFISLFTTKPMRAYLPYVLATVALLVFVMIFAPVAYGKIAAIVFFAIAGIALFYWFVWIIVGEIKKGIQGFRNWRQNL